MPWVGFNDGRGLFERVVRDREAEEDGDIRVLDESGEDYLYEAARFLPVELPAKTVRALNKSFARAADAG